MSTFFTCILLVMLIAAGGSYLYLKLYDLWLDVREKRDSRKK